MEWAVSIVSSVVGSVVSEGVKWAISPIRNRIKYCTGHQKRVQSLKSQVEKLKHAKDRVQHDVDAAKRNGEEIEGDVDEWLTKVDKKIAEEVEEVMQDEEKAKKKCFAGLCPNHWARYKHSVKAEEEANAVAELLRGGNFDSVSYRVPPQGITAATVEGFETFESRTAVFNGIMEALKDDSVSLIGVHGMGGVGKTTLVKQVANQVKEGNLFDNVVIAYVTQTVNVQHIQNQIADYLGLEFNEQSTEGRASRLQERLKKEKKILVVLDDIWGPLDLERVGIPAGECKLLLTSRDRDVLSSRMDTQKDFGVGILEEGEAWDFFKKMAGECIESSDLQSTAIEVAKKCAGLPIAIATIARALRNKKLFEWKSALQELQTPSTRNAAKGVSKEVHSAIELSYNYLEDEEVKFTFLLCSLLGHNGLIEDLLRYIFGMGVFHGINTIEATRNRVLTVLSKLEASCLLLDSYNDERFDIHDVVWDVALSIASRDHQMFVLRNDDKLKDLPQMEIMNNCTAISLLSPHITGELPHEMECPHLSFFLMGSICGLVPANFFKGTERLKVLGLTAMPVSINILPADLRTLRLENCTIEDISIVGKLQNLEILSLAGSDVEDLPKEIAELTLLKLLDLNYCEELKTISPGVLSSLCMLEELYMKDSFDEWEDGAAGNRPRENASLEELNDLHRLTTLYVKIPDAKMIPKHLCIEKLDRYEILIGNVDDWHWFRMHDVSRTLGFESYTRTFMSYHWVNMFLKKSEYLHLGQLKGIKNALGELNNGEDFPDLKRLSIQDGLEVQYIAGENYKFPQLQSMTLENLPQLISFCSGENRCSSSRPCPLFSKQLVFPRLKSLELSSISSERIWHRPLSETYFFAANLKSLIIKGCCHLSHLLSPSIAKSVVNQLKELVIEECICLKEIISTEEIEEEKDMICFPRLNSLKIRSLHNLVGFYSGECNIEFPSLKELEIEDCPLLKGFINEPQADKKCPFSDKVAFHHLESLKLSSISSERIWHRPLSETCYFSANLKSLIIKGCGNLLLLLTPSIAKSMVNQLTELEIAGCPCLKEIISIEEIEEKDMICFRRLNSLKIRSLHNLVEFCSGECNIEFPSLKVLEIEDCPLLKGFINESEMEGKCLFGKKLVFPRLENLKLSSISFERIWHRSLSEPCDFAANLTSLIINSCGNLEHLLSPSIARSVVNKLTDLEIAECPCLREIISIEEIGEGKDMICFPRLNSLKIKGPGNLVEFCSGECNIEFPSLKVLEIDRCPLLKGFITERAEMEGKCLFSKKVALPSLERLKISGLINVKHVWDVESPQGTHDTFQNLREVVIDNCMNLKNVFSVSIANDLPQLEYLKVSDCGVLEEIVSAGDVLEEPIGFKFAKVYSLVLTNLKELKCFYPGQHTMVWPMLKKLDITQYSTLSKIIGIQQVNGNDPPQSGEGQPLYLVEKVLPMLEKLRLTNYCFDPDFNNILAASSRRDDAVTVTSSPIKMLSLNSIYGLKHIWKKDSELGHMLPTLEILQVERCEDLINLGPSSAYFQNLTTLEVTECYKMINLVTPSVVPNLTQLTTMRISHCYRMTEIVANEGDIEATDHEITFSKLKWLELGYLESLTSFCPGKYSIKFPCLEELIVNECCSLKIFSNGVVSSPQLRGVEDFSFDDNARWNGDINTTIKQLYTEKVGYSLELSDVDPELIEKWNGRNPQEDLDLKSLTHLKVCNCSSLKLNYIFTVSMALSLNRLSQLVVKECSTLKRILVEEQSEEEATTYNNLIEIFPCLSYIEIESCSNLISFYFGSHQALEFPSLDYIMIADCPKIRTFANSSISRDEETEINGDGIENVAPFFSHQVGCPNLSNLVLSSLNIHKIWDHQQQPSSLRVLKVMGCHKLKYLFPSFMLKHFVQLKSIDIYDCEMMEEVMFMEAGPTVEERMSPLLFRQLNYLTLEDLPKLSRFCCNDNYNFEFPCLLELTLENCCLMKTFIPKESDENAQGDDKLEVSPLFNEKVALPNLINLTIKSMRNCRMIWPDQVPVNSFLKLKEIEVESCENLSNIFPLNMKRRLGKLEVLQIVNCDSLEEIFIANQPHAVASTQSIVEEKFVFARVTQLRFDKLPKLKGFYSRIHATKWPSLEKMEVIECPNVQIFASDCPGLGVTHLATHAEISNGPPLFRVNEVTFPVLEELKVLQNDTWHGLVHSTEFFRLLKAVELVCIPEDSTALQYSFFQSLPNLEIKLVVKDASSCQIFQFEGVNDDEIHASALTRLSELRLSNLPELTRMWKEEFQPRAAFCGLEILEVLDCGKLKTLAPYLVSFNNLTTLEVSGCHGFINLLTCSTANSLMQLQIMRVNDCEKIEKIIASDADEKEGAVVFSQLRYLQLSCLPSLESFCFGDHSFEFPVLHTVIVRECPKMEIFCNGDLGTPELDGVQLMEDSDEVEERWEGDLKTTIRKLFEETNHRITK